MRGNDNLGGVMPRMAPNRHARPDRASMDSRVRGNDTLGGVMPRLPPTVMPGLTGHPWIPACAG
ncbi:MAG: hypothetical protein NT071_13490, partial [Burkholderiales bacterium]|nr:hypothetical protein [Burkholderiales bacterium]